LEEIRNSRRDIREPIFEHNLYVILHVDAYCHRLLNALREDRNCWGSLFAFINELGTMSRRILSQCRQFLLQTFAMPEHFKCANMEHQCLDALRISRIA